MDFKQLVCYNKTGGINDYKKRKKQMNTYNIKLVDNNQILTMSYGYNGDLYWYLSTQKHNKDLTLAITKENYYIYKLFDELYKKIQSCQIFEPTPMELELCENSSQLSELISKINKLNKQLRKNTNYQKLFKNNIIYWHSDDETFDDANVVEIHKESDKYLLKFIFKNKEISQINTIRFSNHGSIYQPFNILFMNIFNRLQNYNPNYHQIHIEEYLYLKKKTNKKLQIKH